MEPKGSLLCAGARRVQITYWICTMAYWTCVCPRPVDMNASPEGLTHAGQVLHFFYLFFLSININVLRLNEDYNSLITLVTVQSYGQKSLVIAQHYGQKCFGIMAFNFLFPKCSMVTPRKVLWLFSSFRYDKV